MAIVLHQFEFSHFNDKARWALDFKGIEHRRESYLPGPHMFFIRRLSGQAQTPVLAVDNEVIPGSAAIIPRFTPRTLPCGRKPWRSRPASTRKSARQRGR